MLKTNKAVVRLLTALTRGGKYRGNPYTSPEVEAVLRQIAKERKFTDVNTQWRNALDGLPEHDSYPCLGEEKAARAT